MKSATSIAAYLIRRSVFFSAIGFVAIFLIATVAYQQSVRSSAENVAETVAKTTFNAMYLVMSQGWNRQQMEEFISELEAGNKNSQMQLGIYRGSRVEELFGAVSQSPLDRQMLMSMKSGKAGADSQDQNLRYLYPLKAEERCLRCHVNAQVGESLGLISVEQDLRGQVEQAQTTLAWLLILISPVPLFLAWLAIRQIRLQMRVSVNALKKDIQAVETIADLPDFIMPESKVMFTDLQSIFSQVQQLGEKLRTIAVDRDLLEFEIRLLEKFVITSEVVRDWREYVNELMVEINKVIHTHAMFSIFKVDDEQFDLEVFWMNMPSDDSKALMEKAIIGRLQQSGSPFMLSEIKVRHNIAKRDPDVVIELQFEEVELQTKSLLVEAPQIGGIVGVGVQSDIVRSDIRRLVLESILSTLLNVVGSVKAIYKYTRDLEYYATRDPLTNLYNQRMFWELLDYELDRADRHGYSVSLMMIDLDNFKAINDGYGHAAGDQLLTEFSQTLEKSLDVGSIIARYGGDEFVVVLPEAGREKAEEVSQRIMDVMRQLEVDYDAETLKITGSVGVGVYPEHADNRKDLFLFVDNLMYRAKASGKDRVSMPLADELVDIFKDITEKTLLVKQAIEQRALVPVFQPIMGVENQQLAAVEVLSRIELAEGQLMSAGEFIEIAESMDKIHQLDYIVMEKAFAHAQDVGYKGMLFINMSPRSIVVADFLREVKRLVERYDVDASQVVFEITERDTVKNLSVMEQFVNNLKDAGYKLAIDDFGSGFSSFHYLKHFPIDFVKIEGEFIANMSNDHRDMAFVESIAQLSQKLGVETVAEFVESDEVLAEVKAAGITYAQGYHIGRPARHIPMVDQTEPLEMESSDSRY